MKTTTNAGERLKSAADTSFPFVSGNRKSGAFVPNGNIVELTATMPKLSPPPTPLSTQFLPRYVKQRTESLQYQTTQLLQPHLNSPDGRLVRDSPPDLADIYCRAPVMQEVEDSKVRAHHEGEFRVYQFVPNDPVPMFATEFPVLSMRLDVPVIDHPVLRLLFRIEGVGHAVDQWQYLSRSRIRNVLAVHHPQKMPRLLFPFTPRALDITPR